MESTTVMTSRVLSLFCSSLPTALATSVAVFSVPAVLHSVLGVPYAGAFSGAVMLTITMTLAMGLFAHLPFVVVPSVGTCAVLASLCVSYDIDWQTALGLSFWTGIVFLAISLTTLREKMAGAIPPPIRHAATYGVGYLLLKASLLLCQEGCNADSWSIAYIGIGVAVTMALAHREKGVAMGLGASVILILAMACGAVTLPERCIALPDLTTVSSQVRIFDYRLAALVTVMVTMFGADLIDSVSTFVSVSNSMGIDHSGQPATLSRGLFVDSVATFVAPLLGTTPGSTALQSTVVVGEGGCLSESYRGERAVVVALLFVPWLFLAPLATAIPPYAVVPVLGVTGVSLLRPMFEVSCHNRLIAAAQVMTVVGVVCTDSLATGVLVGCLALRLLPLIAREKRYPTYGDLGQSLLTVSYFMILA